MKPIEKIKAEIERLKNELSYNKERLNLREIIAVNNCYNNLILFIDSLEEDPVSNDLEEAADNYVGHAPEIDEDLSCFTKRNAFIAGAKWQKEKILTKACEWLKSYRQNTPDGTGYISSIVNDKTIEDFKQSMRSRL